MRASRVWVVDWLLSNKDDKKGCKQGVVQWYVEQGISGLLGVPPLTAVCCVDGCHAGAAKPGVGCGPPASSGASRSTAAAGGLRRIYGWVASR